MYTNRAMDIPIATTRKATRNLKSLSRIKVLLIETTTYRNFPPEKTHLHVITLETVLFKSPIQGRAGKAKFSGSLCDVAVELLQYFPDQ